MYRILSPSEGAELLGLALAALVQRLRPEWELSCATMTAVMPGAAIRLEDTTSDRWMAVIFGNDVPTRAAQAMAAGACSVVTVGSRVQDFEAALDSLARGKGTYLPPAIAVQLAREAVGWSAQREHNGQLTPRELEVLQCVARGMSNKEIALELGVSVNTVRTHLHSLAAKLDAPSRAGMAAVAWRSGLVTSNH